LLVACEEDLFFPAERLVPAAEKLIANLVATEVLEGSSHYPLPKYLGRINDRIHRFLSE